ncbi:MAG TPA: DEAD/DEAH box helicase [Actinomycetota bacterium]|nr:DEAD/DEAH box helicase [Actinomycetota bacterium]
MSTFAELGVSAPVSRALERRGIAAPFEIQTLVMADALAGRDVLAKSRTGSGKTLAFALPIVERLDPAARRPAALILVPTRELAVQVTEEFEDVARARNLRVAAVYGGVSLGDQAQRASKAHVVVATPGRLDDLVARRMLSLDGVTVLVLDEADRMLDMGFQPQVDHIVRRLSKDRQTMFFSATLDGWVGAMARAYTRDAITHSIEDRRQTVDEAEHRFIPVEEHAKVDKLVELLSEERGLALVFVRTKRGADRLTERLQARGVHASALHGDLTQPARKRALERFESGKVGVLVATDVAARGLDLDDITLVVNYDPPEDHKGYVHRVGRTARAGRSGTGVTFVMPQQRADVSNVARALELKQEFEAEGLKVTKPRVVYSSRGNRSSLRSRPRRRF